MVMVMRAFPDARWSDHVKSESGEDEIGQPGSIKNGVMLKIVEDDEEADEQAGDPQTAKHAAPGEGNQEGSDDESNKEKKS